MNIRVKVKLFVGLVFLSYSYVTATFIAENVELIDSVISDSRQISARPVSAVVSDSEYNGFKLYRLSPQHEGHLEILAALDENREEYGIDFWLHGVRVGEPVDVLVEPQRQEGFERFLNRYEIPYEIKINDLQRAINQERQQRSLLISHLRRGSPTARSGSLDLTRFYTYEEIVAYTKYIASKYNGTVQLYAAGKSHEGRDIPVMIITDGNWNMQKPMIVVDAGIHAREWIAPAEAMYMISQLVEKSSLNKEVLRNVNWAVIPIVNPDGYVYTHQRYRYWRKTRKPSGGKCVGTDANRNYAYHWGGAGASKDPCSDTFRGEKAFSEKESTAVRDVLKKFLPQVKMYLSLHSYGSYILYPWGYAKELPNNWQKIEKMGKIGAEAIKASTGRKYTVGSSAKLLYSAAGGSDDYALSLGIPYAMTMELPRGGLTGFDPSRSEIQNMVTETWVGIKAMAKAVSDEFGSR